MNWDQIGGNWKQARGKVREQWGKLTDDDLDVIAGKRDQLAGRIQHAYGSTKEQVEREIAEFERGYSAGASDAATAAANDPHIRVPR